MKLPLLFVAAAGLGLTGSSFAAAPSDELFAFTDRYCSSCHNDVDKEGGLDLTSMKYAPEDAANFLTWVKVHDRVRNGEMPPPEKPRPVTADLNSFVQKLNASLVAVDRAVVARDGRARQR